MMKKRLELENYEDEEFSYNYYDSENEELEEEAEWIVPEKKTGNRRLLTMIQIMVCFIFLLVVMFLKMFGGNAYESMKEWYTENLNNSIIAQERLDDIKQACLKMLPSNTAQVSAEVAPQKSSSIPSGSDALLTQSIYSHAPVSMSVALNPPLVSGVLTSQFGIRDGTTHHGMDIAAKSGTPIYSALAGKIVTAEKSASYGNYVVIDHGNSIKTLYAHCSTLLTKQGETVKVGQNIAEVGSTGDSTGPHLHFELQVNGVSYNPESLVKTRYI